MNSSDGVTGPREGPTASRPSAQHFAGERDLRQTEVHDWCAKAFGAEHAASVPQRAVRFLEEAIELYQSVGGDVAMAHRLLDYIFAKPADQPGREFGGVGITLLALAQAAGYSAEECEKAELRRVLSKPLQHFYDRNAVKNAAGFDVTGGAYPDGPPSSEAPPVGVQGCGPLDGDALRDEPSNPLPSPERGSAADLTAPYKPVAIHFTEPDALEFVSFDVPTVAQSMGPSLDVLLDMGSREPIGWRIYGWSRIAPSTSPQPAPSSLFQLGEFTLASGAPSAWKIECDALGTDDWAALARMAIEVIPLFGSVEGVPRGGVPFADALRPYAVASGPLLIAEDVVTTGASMERHRAGRDAIGVAVFARGAPPAWVRPLFATAPPAPSDGKEDGSSVAESAPAGTVARLAREDRVKLALSEGFAFHNEEADLLEFVRRDGPTVARFISDDLDVLLDMKTREPIGWCIYGWSKVAPSSEAQPECSERSDDPTLSGTNTKTSDGWMQEVVEVLAPFADFIDGVRWLPDNNHMTRGSVNARNQVTAGQFRAAASLLHRLRGAS